MISETHFTPVASLDLASIKHTLMADPRTAWSAEKAAAAEADYRRFLYSMKMFPEQQATPSPDVDRFWRLHILETRKYAADCARAFGYLLHRSPYVRMSDKDNQEVLRRCSEHVAVE